jgi:signal transduction histidine kinase
MHRSIRTATRWGSCFWPTRTCAPSCWKRPSWKSRCSPPTAWPLWVGSAASIAHEINNPLGGMLNSISTLKKHGSPDPVTQKTVSLLERGLTQIRETVAALLVEAKVKSRPLGRSDLDDVRVLVSHAAKKLATQTRPGRSTMPESVALPSTLVRQVLMNLLLNAITAAGQGGQVMLRVQTDGPQLMLTVENTGKPLLPDQLSHLFEPFTPFSESGNGLGLWICYQIATQLGGTIRAESTPCN